MGLLKLNKKISQPALPITTVVEQKEDLLPKSAILQNPFSKPPEENSFSTKKPRLVVKLPSIITPKTSPSPLQSALDAAEVLPKAREASVEVSQNTADSLSHNFNNFILRVTELEDTVKAQHSKMEQLTALNNQQDSKIIQLQHDLHEANALMATQKVELGEAEKKRIEAEISVATTAEKKNASLEAKNAENTSLTTELSTTKAILEKANEVVRQQKAKAVSAENRLGKVQIELLVARQRADLARKEANDSKQTADNTYASAEKAITARFEDKIVQLESQVRDNSGSAHHKRAVMLQSQVEDLTSKHEKEVANLAKAHIRITELERTVETGADRRARREEEHRVKISLESTERELRTSEAAVKTANAKVTILSEVISRLIGEKEDLTKSLEISKAELRRLKSLPQVNDEMHELREKLKVLESKIMQKDNKISEIEVVRQQLQQQVSSAMSQMIELKRQASLTKQTNASLTNELQALKAQHSSTLSECLAKTNKLRELEATIYDTRAIQLQLMRTGDSEKANLNKEVHRLKSQRGQDHKQINDLESELDSQEEYIERLKADGSDLNRGMQLMVRERNEAQNNASYFQQKANERQHYRY